MNGNCMHCTADKALHRWDTMQCPKGGHEAYTGEQIWLNTVYTEDNSGELKELFARIAELEAQVKRLLEAVPQAGQVAKCPPHMRVKIHTKLFAWQTHDMPAENIQKAECLDCGEWFEVEDIDETAEVRE